MSPDSWIDSQARQWASDWVKLGVQDIPSPELFTENTGFVNMVWGELDPSCIPGDEFMAIDAVKSIISSAWNQAFYLRFPPVGPLPSALTPCEIIRFNISNLEETVAHLYYGMSSHQFEIDKMSSQLKGAVDRRTKCLNQQIPCTAEDRQALDWEIYFLQSSISILNTYDMSDQALREQLVAQINSERARSIELGCHL